MKKEWRISPNAFTGTYAKVAAMAKETRKLLNVRMEEEHLGNKRLSYVRKSIRSVRKLTVSQFKRPPFHALQANGIIISEMVVAEKQTEIKSFFSRLLRVL
jgi:hypothetical protein